MELNKYNCFGCDRQNCTGCEAYSLYHGELGHRTYMSDEEIKDTCGNCSCYAECHPKNFDPDYAKECYNILFSCVEGENLSATPA